MTRKQQSKSRISTRRRRTGIIAGVTVLFVMVVICGSAVVTSVTSIFGSIFGTDEPVRESVVASWSPDSADLTVAVSPVMAPVLQEIANRFNSQDFRTPDGKRMSVATLTLAPDRMIAEAMGTPNFQALAPDSSLWLEELEQAWAAQLAPSDSPIPIGQRRVSSPTRFAVSPIVIAAWESVARDLGWPDASIGWEVIQNKAIEDDDFKWNHAGTNTASGLLATLAEFYAGAGLTRGLTEEAATAPETLEYVQAVEATIRFYGEGEEVIIERLAAEGRSFLDAFVAQERVVLDWNRNRNDERLVAIYPAEGTLWTDHPIALLELGSQTSSDEDATRDEIAVTNNQRLTFAAFTEFLLGGESQQYLLQSGYRPADLSIELDAAGSPFANTDAVDWRQPQTTLQMPSPSVVNVVRNAWYFTKRPTNVYLVVDTSGSMTTDKMNSMRQALRAYIAQVLGDRDRIGIVEFAGGVKSFTPLRVMDDANRRDTLDLIDRMEAYGGTALIDATYLAVEDLQNMGDNEAINAVVVMTDGEENSSFYSLTDLERLVGGNRVTPVIIFTIGFGRDVDANMLERIARIGGGQYWFTDEADIEELYRLISTYF